MDELVTTKWLAERLGEPGLSIVDASAHLPGSGRDGPAEFLEAHIPGAVFLDIDRVSDHDHPAPHMLPSPREFGAAMAALGVGRDHRIIVYDNSDLRTAARGWMMLRHFGADRVAILDGGLQKWKRESRPLQSGAPNPKPARFDAIAGTPAVVTKEDILAGRAPRVVDARAAARFAGSVPEPREGLASGHIPGARSLPFANLYEEDGTLKSDAAIARAFVEAGVDPEAPFTASCGSGVTACSIIFAARRLGNRKGELYDGSWSEWGADPKTPKEKG